MGSSKQEDSWFSNWFNTPYYHILYRNRDFKEGEQFLSRLVRKLDIPTEAHILDLACGKGRHSLFLHSLGYEVTGVDLSEESIEYARSKEERGLHFDVHDMRKPYAVEQFDYVFNLFTSFGYFDDREDDIKVVEAMKQNTKPEGRIVIDFLNAPKVTSSLVKNQIITRDDIEFHITREVTDGKIIKTISFEDKGQSYRFQERVSAFTLGDFKSFFSATGLHLQATFGNYALDSYDPKQSDRLIMVVGKRP
jgi:SAM-dependent methyltransferase